MVKKAPVPSGPKTTGTDRIIGIERIRPSSVNYNRQTEFIYDKLMSSIRTFGFVDPVIVRGGNQDGMFEDGNWEIIGGEHRWRAACFPAGTPIFTRRGYVDIQHVEIDDEVMDSRGEWRGITDVSCVLTRSMTEIRLRRLCFPVISTPNHPHVSYSGGTVLAHKVNPGDWLFIPSPKTTGISRIHIPPSLIQESPRFNLCSVRGCYNTVHAAGLCFSHYRQWRGYKRPFTEFTKVLRQPRCSHPGCSNTIKTGALCTYHANRVLRGVPQRVCLSPIPREYELTPDLMWLFGIYVAEGCILRGRGRKKGIMFCFGVKDGAADRQYIQRAQDILENVFGLPVSYSPRTERNMVYLRVHSPTLGAWFGSLFGDGAVTKRFPVELLGATPELVSCLLEGWAAGDGHKRGPSWNVVTVSRTLAFQAFVVARNAGWLPSMYYTDPHSQIMPSGRVSACRGSYTVRLTPMDVADTHGDARRGVRAVEGGIEVLVDSAKTFDVPPTPVYNMTVAGTHTYTSWGVATHNCQLGMEKIPCRDLGCVSDTTAQRLMIVLNETKGTPDEDALAGLVRTIKETEGMDALDVLPFDMDRLSDLLDAPTAEPELLGDVGQTPETEAEKKPPKLRPVDVANAIGLEGARQRDLARLVITLRQWGASRVNPDVPPWKDLISLLQRDIDARYPASDSEVADDVEDS